MARFRYHVPKIHAEEIFRKDGTRMNYQKRIDGLRTAMAENGVDAFIITPDANMEYYTGVPRLGGGNTKQRQHSIEYACLIVTEKDVVIGLPNLSMLVTQAKLKDKEAGARIVPFPDGDTQGSTIKNLIKQLGLAQRSVGVTQDISAAMVLMLQHLGCVVKDLNHVVFAMRSVKDENELALIRKGVEITDRIYEDVLQMIKPGANVRDIEWEMEKLIEFYGASKSSFPSEVNTHGPNAGHFVGYSHTTVEKGYVIGLDFGVVYEGYCTDFGRTIFVGEPSPEHLKIYDLVRQAQKAAIDNIYPGSNGEKADGAARAVITSGGYGERFIHKLGHSIGLDVHERPFLAKGETDGLKPGMIFAVEPSVFIPKSCFIRLEDQIAVTPDGCEMYSRISQDVVVID